MARSKRHHFLAESYQKNFAAPMFSDTIRVFDFDDGRWNAERRTPNGIGYETDLYAVPGPAEGKVSDEYETKFFKQRDAEFLQPMRKAATPEGCLSLDIKEQIHVARCISYLVSRNPQTMEVLRRGLSAPNTDVWQYLNAEERDLANALQQDPNHRQAKLRFNKFVLDGLGKRADARVAELFGMTWKFIKTTPDAPFITSDFPAYAETSNNQTVYSCPISSLVSVVIASAPRLKYVPPVASYEDVRQINRQTFSRAREFIICCRDDFPGFEDLQRRFAARKSPC